MQRILSGRALPEYLHRDIHLVYRCGIDKVVGMNTAEDWLFTGEVNHSQRDCFCAILPDVEDAIQMCFGDNVLECAVELIVHGIIRWNRSLCPCCEREQEEEQAWGKPHSL